MLGTWNGYYKYDNPLMQKASGYEQTFFSIRIDSFDGTNFKGIVNDDTSTGGMDGTGEIVGELINGEISFRKFMPRRRLIYSDGKHVDSNKKHPTLYYSGQLASTGDEFAGIWEFKNTIYWLLGFIPIPVKPGKGTWGMKRIK